MSNKDNQIVQPNGEVILPSDLQSDTIIFDEEKRQKVIQILRQIPAYFDVARNLTEGRTYQAIFPPEVLERIKDGMARLDKKDSGLYGVLIRDVETGHVTNHVSLMEVTPDLLSSLSQLATQQTLANVVHRLEVIDEKITNVLQGQANDRLAEVESGIDTYEQAVVASDPDVRRELLVSAIQKLNDGRNKLMKSTDFGFIYTLPRNRLGMIFSLNWDIPKDVRSKAESVWKAAHAIIKSSRYLVLAYSDLNEPDSLRVSLEQMKSEVKDFQDKIGEVARWLEPTSILHEDLTTISQGVLPNIHDLDEIPQRTIIVEFKPKEIDPPEGI